MVLLEFLVFDRRFFCCAPWSYLVRVPWQLGYLRSHLWAVDVSLCLRCLHWSDFCRGPGWQVLFQRCFIIGHCGGTLGTRHVCSLYGIQVHYVSLNDCVHNFVIITFRKWRSMGEKRWNWKHEIRYMATALPWGENDFEFKERHSSSLNALNWAIQICILMQDCC